MDWAVDARLPQRYKEWRREVRNELRLSMAEDSDKTELWACTYVVVCSGEQGEDILQQAGMLGSQHRERMVAERDKRRHRFNQRAREFRELQLNENVYVQLDPEKSKWQRGNILRKLNL
ncbi:hypothetical protein CAPTEDRAFT_215338 [Capitella teleta]|uniref:Uncharacterized protein n=1 Tax=Capitella teleta TaxID=283909 RepID=R7V8C3_CAPTE|nr:hypothetical protein CAPTEDRAFT_215338 [Capitella teleta]|eukprot:ELU14742.1 hypothetical protein CAPTEDRAFT_215338 [Capitella teleta]